MDFCKCPMTSKKEPLATIARAFAPPHPVLYNRTNRMLRIIPPLLLAAQALFPADATYELVGQFTPAGNASVSLFGVSGPFSGATLSDSSGRFAFKKLEPGTYTLAIFLPTEGEARQTVEIGPSSGGDRHRVTLSLHLKPEDFARAPALARHTISTKQLTIPDKALRLYDEAEKFLSRRDAESAVARLEQAVEIAPQFSAAWNQLGTIAYQARKYSRAEECFRESLAADPSAYEPLVNLGGVLINLHKLDEARDFNTHAVLLRPADALANSQLGMTYFEMDRPEKAEEYFVQAVALDPAHFSHPQLFLADIHLRRGDRKAAANDLQNFLDHHPDWPDAAKVRETVASLRK
jgi:tetratricopeptide (TPR) repeat protein